MGSQTSRLLEYEKLRSLMEETGFSENKLNQLNVRFQSLDRGGKNHLTRDDILQIEELQINPLADRIVDSFFRGSDSICFDQFVTTLATFRPVARDRRDSTGSPTRQEEEGGNSRTSKLKFVFSMYDKNGDGEITKSELLEVLSMMVDSNVSKEQLRMIAERTILDSSPLTRVIGFDDFEKIMTDVLVESKMVVKFQT